MTWGNGVSAKRYREDRKVCWLEGDVSITLYVEFVASSGCPEDNLEICTRTGENCWRQCPSRLSSEADSSTRICVLVVYGMISRNTEKESEVGKTRNQ